MILAMKKIGLSSGPKTIVTFLLISIFTDSLSYFLTDPLVENDAFIAAFYGGAILGLALPVFSGRKVRVPVRMYWHV